MTETTTRYEAETDTQLAAAHEALMDARHRRDSAADNIHYAARDKKDYRIKSRPVWKLSLDEAIEKLDAMDVRYSGKTRADLIAAVDAAIQGVSARQEEVDRLEALYTGWSRFFIVPGGHIHSSRRCSTCYPTTMFGWLPQLSGLTEADAVAEHGPLLCSVCYPLAPVEWTVGPEPKKTYCSGTGKAPVVDPKVGHTRRYMACPDCGKYGAVTSTGLVRAHQR